MILLLRLCEMVDFRGDEVERPDPRLHLYQQGLHPNPGPGDPPIQSRWDDPYWKMCGWSPPTGDAPKVKVSTQRLATAPED